MTTIVDARSWIALTLVLVLGLVVLPGVSWAVEQPPSGSVESPRNADESFRVQLARFLWTFLLLCGLALVLLIVVAAFLFWHIKKLVENAVKPDLPGLEQLIEKLRRKHGDLDDAALAKKIILRQANRAGLIGFVTGLGGLPFLPIAIPIDIAVTIKLQSNLIHLLRLLKNARAEDKDFSDTSLWLITTGGQELTTATSTLIRELLVKFLSKSVLKFLPILGGFVGFLLNWISTQALGRLTLKWLDPSS